MSTPKSKKSTRYTSHNFRIDRQCDDGKTLSDDEFKTQMGSFFSNYMYNICTHVVVMKEYANVTGKLHWHANVVYRSPQLYVTIKKKWDSCFPYHSGSTKSMATPKKKTNLSYICKDKNPTFWKGYTKEEINQIGDQWIHRTDKKKVNAVTTITAELREKYPDEKPWDFDNTIIDKVLDYYKVQTVAVQRFMLYAVVDGVRLQFDEESSIREEIKSGYQRYRDR